MWPEYPARDYKEVHEGWKFFVDSQSGLTVAEFSTVEAAIEFTNQYGGTIRPYLATNEALDAEFARRREDRRQGITVWR